MRSTFSSAFIACAIICISAPESSGEPTRSVENQRVDEGIDISAKINKTEADRELLTLTLTNQRSQEVRILRQTLWRGNMVLQMVCERLNTPLKEDSFVDDLPFGDWPVRPGESVSYNIDLTALFPDMQDLRKQNTLVLFWALRIRFADSLREDLDSKPWVGGYLLLKRIAEGDRGAPCQTTNK